MTVNEFWARIGINGAIIALGIFIAASGGVAGGGLIALAGVAFIAWTGLSAWAQTRKMDRAIAAKRNQS